MTAQESDKQSQINGHHKDSAISKTNMNNQNFISYHLKNVHYLKGESLTPTLGDIFVSGKDGQITLSPENILKESEIEGGVISQLIGGGDHHYLVIPALRNTLNFKVDTNLPAFYDEEELLKNQISNLQQVVRESLEKSKTQGVSNVTLKLEGARSEERVLLENCLKESGLRGNVLTTPDEIIAEQQQVTELSYRENIVKGLTNDQIKMNESSIYHINTSNVRLTTNDIWQELHAITLDMMLRNGGKLPIEPELIFKNCVRGGGKLNLIEDGAFADLVIMKLDHSLLPFKGALSLLLKGEAHHAHGLIRRGKFIHLTSMLSNEIIPLHSKKSEHHLNGVDCEFDSVEEAILEIGKGNFVIVVDNEDRENEGDLIMACEHVTEEKMAFLIRHTSGLVCISTTSERLNELQLPLMVQANNESFKTAFTVSIDYTHGTTTGISAYDRALTARAVANPKATHSDFNKPGHMFPLRYTKGGVLTRMGHTEATVDLCKMSGLYPAGILCEIALDNGKMARRDYLRNFANIHNIKMITISDMIKYRKTHNLIDF